MIRSSESEFRRVLGERDFQSGKFLIAHFHTTASDGLRTPSSFVEEAVREGVDALMPADHDTLKGFSQMWDYKEKHGYNNLQLIPAEEVTTKENIHLLAVNIPSTIPYGQSLEETVRMIEDVHAHTMVPHVQMDRHSATWDFIAAQRGKVKLVEVYNAGARKMADGAQKPWLRPFLKKTGSNDRALQYFQKHGHTLQVQAVGGVDAHYRHDFADALMVYPPDVEPVEAMLTGEVTIFERIKQSPVTLYEFFQQRHSASELEKKRRQKMI